MSISQYQLQSVLIIFHNLHSRLVELELSLVAKVFTRARCHNVMTNLLSSNHGYATERGISLSITVFSLSEYEN